MDNIIQKYTNGQSFFLNAKEVSIVRTECCQYSGKETLFRPSGDIPEYPFVAGNIMPQNNKIYEAVRESLHLLNLDERHFGTEEWNPLKDFIKPGDTVLIKPNLVMDYNPNGEGTDCLYTQPAVVTPILDYVLIALNGTGKVVIGDAPMQECRFEKLIKESGYEALVEWYRSKGHDVELVDFRELKSEIKHGLRIQHINKSAKGKIINLGEDSEFAELDINLQKRMRVTNYDPTLLKEHHTYGKHEYYISDYVLEADCIINMPKPKTHRKAGVTSALKNLVGINVRKEFLPHHTIGSPIRNGDEYEKKSFIHSVRSKLLDGRNIAVAQENQKKAYFYRCGVAACSAIMRIKGTKYSEGSWYGNHTISRTIADLNKIIFYADKCGNMQKTPQRKMLIVADMIVMGEKEGSVEPSAKTAGIIAAGFNPVCFDEAIISLMGFDIEKIPTIQTVRGIKGKYRIVSDFTKPMLYSNDKDYDGKLADEITSVAQLNLIPAEGWKGHIEKM